jgi:L-rhamnose-H+ transport protein
MSAFWLGLLLVFSGAAMQGSFTLPQKYMRGWAWEKGWLLYSIAAMIIYPWLLVAWLVPEPGAVYSSAGAGVVARTALFGAGWGVGSVLFGLGVARVGMALGFAIIISVTAAVGSVAPMAIQQPEKLASTQGLMLLAGLAAVIVGIALCAKAGSLKETATRGQGFTRGLLICIVSGLTSPMMNFAFSFGKPIQDEAARLGAGPALASIAVLAVAVSAGFVLNAGYCLCLLGRNRTWRGDAPVLRYTLFAAIMGFLWLFGMYCYGMGASHLGETGTSVGWALFMTVIVLVANFWGLLTGEWRGAPRRVYGYLGAGLSVMIAALVIIAAGARA